MCPVGVPHGTELQQEVGLLGGLRGIVFWRKQVMDFDGEDDARLAVTLDLLRGSLMTLRAGAPQRSAVLLL